MGDMQEGPWQRRNRRTAHDIGTPEGHRREDCVEGMEGGERRDPRCGGAKEEERHGGTEREGAQSMCAAGPVGSVRRASQIRGEGGGDVQQNKRTVCRPRAMAEW